MKLLDGVRQWWRKQAESSGKPWAILLILGLLMAVIAWPVGDENEGKGDDGKKLAKDGGEGISQVTDNLTYEEQLEEKLASILSRVKGAGKVEVMITLVSSSELVLQADERKITDESGETDRDGGTKSSSQSEYTKETVLTGNADGPYVIKEINPQVSGVLILAQGAGSAAVKNEICEAVEALFNLPIHKIKVLEAE